MILHGAKITPETESVLDASGSPLVETVDLRKTYRVQAGYFSKRKKALHAVDGVSLSIFPGETFGLVGESGCGKSTFGRLVLYLETPTSGLVRFRSKDLAGLSPSEMRTLRRHMQIIFQDPYSSLNPRKRAGWLIGEPLVIHKVGTRSEILERVAELMREVGLKPDDMNRYPHQFSGGQRQRIGIARALALNPDLIVADEPVSALDVSVQAQVLQLLETLQGKYNLTYILISHDLGVIHHLSDRIGVMYLGQIVDIAPKEMFLAAPYHPYTEALLASAPKIDPQRRHLQRAPLTGDVPSPLAPPPGCRFHTRCPYAEAVCRHEHPVLENKGDGHYMACHFR